MEGGFAWACSGYLGDLNARDLGKSLARMFVAKAQRNRGELENV